MLRSLEKSEVRNLPFGSMRFCGLRLIGGYDAQAPGKGVGGRCCTWSGVDGWLGRARDIMVSSHVCGGWGWRLGDLGRAGREQIGGFRPRANGVCSGVFNTERIASELILGRVEEVDPAETLHDLATDAA